MERSPAWACTLAALVLCGPGCKKTPSAPDASAAAMAAQKALDNRGSSLRPPPRPPRAPRPETPDKKLAARREAQKQVKDLLKTGISPREVASVADTRGYQFFHWRYFQRAQLWFEQAVRVDPTYELSLYNAARCAAALGDHKAAIKHLTTLEGLDTPLSRSRLVLAREDPDLSAMKKRLEQKSGARER